MIISEGLRILFGLIAVLGLIGACAIAARKFGLVSASGGFVRKRRLHVIETLALDARRRVVIVRCDDKEHLIVLGQSSETVVDSMPATGALNIVPEAPTTETPSLSEKIAA